ncbi:MAG TPA: DUF5615 family PIN-like protein [Chloroflexota bacterium]|nr:DUF5615 family PIN-like protein [Chloroflexota bacterium]
MKVRFLLDENLPPRLKPAVLRYNAQIDIIRMGDDGAPPLGTSDPDILKHAEETRYVLVTNNRKSMPVHIAEHAALGRHHWGVLRIRSSATIRQVIEEVALIWEASDAEEWIDRDDWIPL